MRFSRSAWRAWTRRLGIQMRAASYVGRIATLKRRGQLSEALELGRRGLQLLQDPNACRDDGGLVTLTINVEGLACQLGEPGASAEDLRDTLHQLCGVRNVSSLRETAEEWIPYLTHKVRLLRAVGSTHQGPHNPPMQPTGSAGG